MWLEISKGCKDGDLPTRVNGWQIIFVRVFNAEFFCTASILSSHAFWGHVRAGLNPEGLKAGSQPEPLVA